MPLAGKPLAADSRFEHQVLSNPDGDRQHIGSRGMHLQGRLAARDLLARVRHNHFVSNILKSAAPFRLAGQHLVRRSRCAVERCVALVYDRNIPGLTRERVTV
jgi:hypothetical protein